MFTTRMTIVKLSDKSVWVESPVPVPFEVLKKITEIGPVRYIVAATQRHVWRLETWHTLFPEAQVWAAETTSFTLKTKSVFETNILGDAPESSWTRDLDQLSFKGSPFMKEVLFFHKKSRTVILNDLIQIHSLVKGKPLRNSLIKLGGVSGPDGGVSRDIRLAFTNRKLARQSLQKLLSWDFDRLIIAHGPCIEQNAKAFVEKAFRWLAK